MSFEILTRYEILNKFEILTKFEFFLFLLFVISTILFYSRVSNVDVYDT
jgi:hypothetical protein